MCLVERFPLQNLLRSWEDVELPKNASRWPGPWKLDEGERRSPVEWSGSPCPAGLCVPRGRWGGVRGWAMPPPTQPPVSRTRTPVHLGSEPPQTFLFIIYTRYEKPFSVTAPSSLSLLNTSHYSLDPKVETGFFACIAIYFFFQFYIFLLFNVMHIYYFIFTTFFIFLNLLYTNFYYLL